MRRQGPITMRHIVVAALVVVVINAQLTWWIVFVLRLNRSHLDLERERLRETARLEAVRIEAEIGAAREALSAALLAGALPGRDPVPRPYVGWRQLVSREKCPQARVNSIGALELSVATRVGCVTGIVAADRVEEILHLPADLEIVEGSGEPEGVVLSEPFSDRAIRPRPEAWEETLARYRRRIVMMVSEGSFFALLLFVLIGLLWMSLRREVELQRQHRNFLSAITHELKSPLAAIRLSLETVASGRASPEAVPRFLSNALDDASRLQDLVQKVLEATRYGEGGSRIERRHADLSTVVADSVDTFARSALAAGARVESGIENGLWAEIDAEAIAIAVSNLLENAIKYGGAPPLVSVRLATRNGDAVLEVGDNGGGIPRDEIPMIFQRFYRAGDEMTRTTRGTGLGLYLVQQIIAAHGGSVSVMETGPEGTRFEVVIPGAESREVEA
jgi:signal transduction histidine kinase